MAIDRVNMYVLVSLHILLKPSVLIFPTYLGMPRVGEPRNFEQRSVEGLHEFRPIYPCI